MPHNTWQQQTLVQPVDRQWAQSRDLLLVHPENQTDSFILYIKGTILICKDSPYILGILILTVD